MRPSWTVHLRPETALPTDPAACRQVLRQGTLIEALLPGSAAAAVRVGAVEVTHAALRQRVERVAAGLAAHGLHSDARVSLYAANALSWIVAYLAALRTDASDFSSGRQGLIASVALRAPLARAQGSGAAPPADLCGLYGRQLR
jgi:hypothetical protein